MTEISAVIITKNEECNIERCLKSIQGLVEELIVVDSGSTDRTEEICLSYGARFEYLEWQGYSAQKNYANSLARKAFILSLDADEEISVELKASILAVKKELSGVYGFHRLTNYCGSWIHHSGWYPDTKWRLFPANIAEWEGDFVHEDLQFKGDPPFQLLHGDLLHYSYNSSWEHRKRADKYSALTAKKLFAQGKNASMLKPYLSGLGRWIKMYLLQSGFRDGKAGKQIAKISAKSNVFKYKELRRLHRSKKREKSIKTLALVRTDSIGDVMLSLPMAGVIKSEWPNCRVIFIGKSYTEPVIRNCKHIDSFMNVDDLRALSGKDAIIAIKEEKIDAIVHVFPEKDIVKWAKQAAIPVRVATARRFFTFLNCNYRLWYSRKKSELHESELNIKMLGSLDLASYYKTDTISNWYGFGARGKLPFELESLLNQSSEKKVVLHPKSKGSAVEWSVENFGILASRLSDAGHTVFITGTEAERGLIGDEFPWEKTGVHDLTGAMSLEELILFISKCDALVAASTGPLHIAAALGIRAVGLYTPQRPMHPGRWAPLGIKAEVITAERHPSKNESLDIDPATVEALLLL